MSIERRHLWMIAVCAALAPSALAAGAMPPFFTEVVCLVLVCAVMGYLCFRLGLVPILGFLVTGVVLNAAGLVQEPALVEAMAEVGVILLLFTIGIEFSIESLMRIKRLIFVGGGLQVGLTTASVTGVLMAFGTAWRPALFTGMLVALSSTAIVLKLLESRDETRTEPGQLAVGMLIFQDLAVVGMVIAVPLLGPSAAGEGGGMDKLVSLGVAVAVMAVVLVLARRLVPHLLEALARTCSPEVFLLGVIAICLGTAFLTGFAGISLSLGAFLAGLLVSESRFGSQALGEILPLQILFSATFFVSVGLLLDVGFLIANIGMVVAVVAAVLVLKGAITTISARVLGFATGPSLAAGLLLAQVGEFAFVLERAGREAGLSPAGTASGGQTFIAASVLLMAATPFLAQAGTALERRLARGGRDRGVAATALHDEALDGHVLILGYARTAHWLSRQLQAADVPFMIITLSPTGATEAEAAGMRVLRGDYTKTLLLTEGSLRSARLVVIADDTPEMAERAMAVVHATVASMPVLVKTTFVHDAEALAEAGAARVITEEGPGREALRRTVFARLGIQAEAVEVDEMETPTLALSPEQLRSSQCTHLDQTQVVSPTAIDHCPECVASGDRWVHLRVCMTCGHVGCCDTSENQHASQHARETGHPVIRSLEPGETWAWCFEDEVLL